MSKSVFAGLEIVPPGGSISQDNYAFQSENPVITDFLLKVGAVLHRHDAHAPMANPTAAPTLAVSAGGDGTIASGQTIYVAYTLNDTDGGETLPTAVATVATPAGYADPSTAPTAVVSFAAGSLLAGTPLYAITVTDGNGGETALGPAVSVTVPPAASAEVNLSGLSAITNASSDNAATAGWRMWRSIDGGGTWWLMSTGPATTDTWTDDGSAAGDCSVSPPAVGTTGNSYSLSVTVPSADQPAEATLFNIYACTDGQFANPALLSGALPISDLGVVQNFTSLATQAGNPPAVSSCFPGANQLDPDTDLINWYWKSPVATFDDLPSAGNSDGDVRVVSSIPDIYIYQASTETWEAWSPGASTVVTTQEGGDTYTLTADDLGTVKEMTSSDPSTVLIPMGLGSVGSVLELCQVGAVVTITGDTGVTVDVPAGFSAQTGGQWASVGLRQRNTNEWLLSGNLAS